MESNRCVSSSLTGIRTIRQGIEVRTYSNALRCELSRFAMIKNNNSGHRRTYSNALRCRLSRLAMRRYDLPQRKCKCLRCTGVSYGQKWARKIKVRNHDCRRTRTEFNRVLVWLPDTIRMTWMRAPGFHIPSSSHETGFTIHSCIR